MATTQSDKLGVYEAIYGRRMAWEFQDREVPQSAIERMLDAAVWAPNHRLTEPWRFFVLPKDSPTRLRAAALAEETALQRTDDPRRAEMARTKVLDPQYVIYVYCVPGQNDETTKENYASVCCAAHNMALAGVAEGLAVTWETGGAMRHPGLYEALGADEEWTIVTMLLIGYPGENPNGRRTPVSQFVRWFPAE